jgi:hypothetical protein
MEQIASPSLPLPASLVLSVMCTALLVFGMLKTRDVPTRFLLVSIWLRYMSGPFHVYTFAPVLGGMSFNALLSVGTVFAGVALVEQRGFREYFLIPVYAMLAIILISGLGNWAVGGTIDMFFKWSYVAVFIIATRQGLRNIGPKLFFEVVLLSFCAPVLFQLASIALGIAKAGESDGSNSYIGGYHHEAAFSVVMLTFVYVVFLAERLPVWLKAVLITEGTVGIFLANYRTAVLALIPVLVSYVVLGTVNRFVPRQRALITILTIPVAAVLMMVASEHLAQRFQDIGSVLDRGSSLFKVPEQFSQDDKALFSGRVYIWSEYITAYAHGRDFQLLFGQGPNTWTTVFDLYAHNTLVSYLYELGVFGVAGVLSVWATFLVLTLKVADPAIRRSLLFAQAGFLILNMATMPHWMIEGNILFALLQGYVAWRVELSVRQREAIARPAPERIARPRQRPAGAVARLRADRPDYSL